MVVLVLRVGGECLVWCGWFWLVGLSLNRMCLGRCY